VLDVTNEIYNRLLAPTPRLDELVENNENVIPNVLELLTIQHYTIYCMKVINCDYFSQKLIINSATNTKCRPYIICHSLRIKIGHCRFTMLQLLSLAK
jgi:hypothetical protein